MDSWEVADKVIGALSTSGGRICLEGPPGTGKTTFGVTAGGCKDAYTLNVTDEMYAAEARGMYVPVEGRFLWQDGPALAAWREGKRLVIDEIDKSSGDMVSFLQGLLNDRAVARMTLPNKETIMPAKGFHVVATMNGSPDDLLPALRDRFDVILHIGTPHPKAIASLPKDVQVAAANSNLDDPERAVSVRRWKAYTQLRDQVGNEVAAVAVFGRRSNDVLSALKIAKAPTAKKMSK